MEEKLFEIPTPSGSLGHSLRTRMGRGWVGCCCESQLDIFSSSFFSVFFLLNQTKILSDNPSLLPMCLG